MSQNSPFHQELFDRLAREFGEPDNTLGKDHHWSLRPKPELASINILINGTMDQPAIWIFDPFAKHDGVYRRFIKDADEVGEIIHMIRVRLKQAVDSFA
jgi:hypothetical protein